MTHDHGQDWFSDIQALGEGLRQKKFTAEAMTRTALEKIDALDPKLSAFTYVAHEEALQAARHVDALLQAGTDLGPLMGVPIAIKDLFTVEGMPTTAGSRVDVSDLVAAEGPFVRRLKSLGCIVLGKNPHDRVRDGHL